MNGSRKYRTNVCMCVRIALRNPLRRWKEKKESELKAFNSKHCVESNQRILRTVKPNIYVFIEREGPE